MRKVIDKYGQPFVKGIRMTEVEKNQGRIRSKILVLQDTDSSLCFTLSHHNEFNRGNHISKIEQKILISLRMEGTVVFTFKRQVVTHTYI